MISHLYVHFPFCLRRCTYCDFAVQAVSAAPTGAWLEAIGREVSFMAREAEWHERPALDTIYVGGGTPSLVGGAGLAGLRDVLARSFTWTHDVEWTAEANPESLTEDVARDWVRAGVNRVSLGAQSFDENVLRWMGRMHGADGPARAVASLRTAGIDNLSLDLIFGVPARFQRDWSNDLDRVIELGPEHVSLYGLTAEKGTPLGRWVEEGREALGSEDQYVEEYLLAAEKLTATGYEHYEVSNFARPGRASRHNQAYWQGVPYLGLGPGSHSFLPPTRYWNVRDWGEYAQRLAEGRSARASEEVVGDESAKLERSWLGLRTRAGLSVVDLTAEQRRKLAGWQRAGLASLTGEVVQLTPQGWLLLDRLVVELEAS